MMQTPAHYFWYQDSDDRLEASFGDMRTATHGQNVSSVEFELRAYEIMRLACLYTLHPEWKRNTRRLAGPLFDHLNPPSILGPSRDTAPVDVTLAPLPSCWALAAHSMANTLTASGLFSAAEGDKGGSFPKMGGVFP